MSVPLQMARKRRVKVVLCGEGLTWAMRSQACRRCTAPLADHIADIVLVVGQPVQRERRIVLQVAIAAVQPGPAAAGRPPDCDAVRTRVSLAVTIWLEANVVPELPTRQEGMRQQAGKAASILLSVRDSVCSTKVRYDARPARGLEI